MITGEKKQQVDNIWQIFWNSGFTQPSAIFEQITYLLFMKMLDEKQLEKESIANLTGDKLLNPTFPEEIGTIRQQTRMFHTTNFAGMYSKSLSHHTC
jgi:type I restriction enzyme M protein